MLRSVFGFLRAIARKRRRDRRFGRIYEELKRRYPGMYQNEAATRQWWETKLYQRTYDDVEREVLGSPWQSTRYDPLG